MAEASGDPYPAASQRIADGMALSVSATPQNESTQMMHKIIRPGVSPQRRCRRSTQRFQISPGC